MILLLRYLSAGACIMVAIQCSGTHPTNDISIEFEIRPKFGVL